MENKDNNKQKDKENEADSDDSAVLIEKALKSFCCYLYVGKGYPYYKAKPWNDDDSYSPSERLQSLEILAANKTTELVPIDKIKLAMDSTLIRRPETLMFALAMCARQKKSEKLRAAAYYFLAEHCKKWEYFILFIKYASILCKMGETAEKDGTSKHIGCGHGWRNAVNKWYLSQTAESLTQLVTRHKGNYGWKHSDILKLSHPDTKSLEVEKQAILCYVIRGLEQAEKEYNSDPEAKNILQYIRGVELFKKCENHVEVAKLIGIGNFTIDQVHPKALKSKEIWHALLKNMDVRTILKNLPKLNNLGVLTKVSPATQLVVRSLTQKYNFLWNDVLPADILSVLNRYEQGPAVLLPDQSNLLELLSISEAKLALLSLRSKNNRSKKRAQPSPCVAPVGKPNKSQTNEKSKKSGRTIKCPASRPVREADMRIRDALRTALNIAQTVDITGSSKRTYLVSVKLPGRYRSITCAEAGLAIALPLLHRVDLPDSAVTIVEHDPRMFGGLPSKITKDMSFDDALALLYETRYKRKELVYMPYGPLGWAYDRKEKYDVFINFTNDPPDKEYLPLAAEYRKTFDLPNFRFINVIVSQAPLKLKGDDWHDTLTVNGFDPNVPWIIEAYVRGLF